MRVRNRQLVVTMASGVVFLAFGATPVAAQTADGETPAEEDICATAGLSGALQGLCNAYCEAMDCDSDNPHASSKACENVSGNWDNHSDGQVLPCEVDCPCWGDTGNLWSALDACPVPTGFQDFSNLTRIKVVAGCNLSIIGGSPTRASTELFFEGTGNPNEGLQFCVSDIAGVESPALILTDVEVRHCIEDIVEYPRYDRTFFARCADGVDNDGDGLIDLDDPGCRDGNDQTETVD